MSRKAPIIELNPDERKELERIVASPSAPQGRAERARIILMAAYGKENREIASTLEIGKNAVTLWRKRFRWERMKGLLDHPGRGRKRKYRHDERLKLIAKSCEKPPEAQNWTIRDLAEAVSDLGLSKSTVGRILKEIDLKPHLVEGWLNSRDPEFDRKAAAICGLYLNPPENALVVCVDEKTGIQALGRKYPDLPERPGSRRKREFEYVRHGTASLFAAFVVHSGEVLAEVKDKHTRVEFIEFLDGINRSYPEDKMVYVIVDNLAVHKTQEVKEWLQRHQRFQFFFTPTHASWLNQVEMWFSILSKRYLKNGIFNSREELVQGMMEYIGKYNQHAKPFRWTYAADPLRI
jgi:transposase